ncbi:MAG: PRC-barrel domain-containing protein [Hyphomicrobiaceae bacterium]|nr:PRC-barrel domain-containing protein [Hyphomicrobiaceae bacterium]
MTDLVDTTVYGAQGQRLGSINEVLMDRAGQQYAVIGYGGFLGLGETQVVVPLQQFQLRGNNLFAPELTQSQLQAMPQYRAGDQNYSVVQGQQRVQVRPSQ